ncbi:MAG: hypothetical protein JW900_08690 [Anaerolineae bacterium]|nr:hypothetical protein [Anaerolineae bacterium]
MNRQKIFSFALTIILLLGLIPAGRAQGQDDPAARLLARMSPAARVGQLFIVTFPGTEIDESSAIYDLIVEERIGGVILRPENGNVVGEGNALNQLATLTNNLQRLAWNAAQNPVPSLPDESGEPVTSPFVPLFITIEEEGGGLYTIPVSGTTPLPSPMAIGATWDPAYAEAVGAILGQELNALGINLFLGPALDVLATPRPNNLADLGVRSFGGDPYWVGQIGAAYVRGVHGGSEGRVAVVPGHFPGLGAADRALSEEVSTVQKSLEQLKQIELAPFFAVASAEDPSAQADGLLVSHIRYRGFQGNIYQSTKPVSFDPQALQQLMALPELATWREGGGITVADDLGVRAVQRFYDPTGQEFNSLRIAREAFVAGNDLLILSHFALDDDWDTHFTNIRAAMAFFREKYATDPTFQERVDAAVLRILRLKLRLYNSPTTFTLNTTQVNTRAASEIVGQNLEQISRIARDSVTLLSPPSPDLRPAPPSVDEHIVIFSDDRQVIPCADCEATDVIPPTLLAEAMLRLYGPQTTRQVLPSRVSSFTFSELVNYLTEPPPTLPADGTPVPVNPVETALQQANWVIFAMLDVSPQYAQSSAVRQFLAERADLLRGKNVVVFAFGAPYYLDTTEIAKLQAYFGLYSHTEPFVETAIRALFDEFRFTGASPVSVPGTSYNLLVQTQPNPDQVIQLSYHVVGEETASPETPQPTPQPIEILQGDTLQLQTSTIVDRNGNRVPDGTPVEFIFTYPQQGLEHTVQVTTRQGIAETTISLDRTGQLQVSVRAEPVPRAVRLEMDIREGEPAVIIPITPTPSPTATPAPTSTPEPTPEAATPVPAEKPVDDETGRRGRIGVWDLIQAIAGGTLIGAAAYVGLWRRQGNLVAALRGALCCFAAGLVAYVGLALNFPGIGWVQRQVGQWTAGVVVTAGAMIALVVAWLAGTRNNSG